MFKIKNIIIFFSGLTIFLIAFLYISASAYSVYGSRIEKIKIGENIFQTERVSSPERLQKGLSNRKTLCQNCAMLFEFPKAGRRSFWMKDMNFPLDIIWIENKKIVHIEKNVPENFSKSICPETPADQVLEINAGLVDKLNIEAGEQITFP